MRARSSSVFPRPISVAASGVSRDCTTRSSTSAPAPRANSANSFSDSSGPPVISSRNASFFHSNPTRIAPSLPWRLADVMAYASFSSLLDERGAGAFPEDTAVAGIPDPEAWGERRVTTVEIACLKINCS